MKRNLKPYVLLLPVMLVILGIFVSGLVMALIQSLGYFPVVGLKDITLKYYKEVLTDKSFLSSLSFSLYISFTSSIIAIIVGILLAYSILRSNKKERMEQIVYKLPIIVPHAVAALLMYNVLSQSGILPRILYNMGIISSQSEFPSLIFDNRGIGIILAYVWKEIPFIAMVVYTILSNINDKLSEVALNLGANKRQVFFHILLPLIMPSVFSAFIIIFAFSFGAFEVPYLLGPTAPKALPVKAYIEYNNPDLTHRPYSMVINMSLTFISIILVWLYHKSFKLISKYDG
ncbi:ABC transporter permease [Thermohalobacter berrensis]|uniref:Spermidine/putrescine ABC transporter permease n=1 Tax=Thermohalobacter berrensis TaxID=99594 RepID=A0A419SUX4_9FIRM|nr:ABC transporter permease subunit [Thermohalobacter berrensis]RKD29028.1 spermidine/putrescine ABC transporter permease [Thermohalobacter berrensis]